MTIMTPDIQEKRDRLFKVISSYPSLGVAFSGGVDSTLLLAAARHVLGDRVVAFSSASMLIPKRERAHAAKLAEELGVKLVWVKSKALDDSEFLSNPKDRCYICKKHLFSQIKAMAGKMGISLVAHGANADDLKAYRPGNKAAEIHNIVAPLVAAELNKAQIRTISRAMGLSTWNKPAMSCLATRIPYGTLLTRELLERVENAEMVMADLGFSGCRVRQYGGSGDLTARIEVAPDEFHKAIDSAIRRRIVEALREIGYMYVTLDLEGYISGSMDRILEDKPPAA